MTAQGLYDIEHAYKVAEIAKEGDEKRLENGRKIAEICSKGIVLVYFRGFIQG